MFLKISKQICGWNNYSGFDLKLKHIQYLSYARFGLDGVLGPNSSTTYGSLTEKLQSKMHVTRLNSNRYGEISANLPVKDRRTKLGTAVRSLYCQSAVKCYRYNVDESRNR